MSGRKKRETSSAPSPHQRRYTQEEKDEAMEMLSRGIAPNKVAEAIGATTESLRLWKKKAGGQEGSGVKELKDEPPEPAPVLSPGGLSEPEVNAILEIKKKHPSMGPAQVRAQLRRFKGWRISCKAIEKVFKMGGYETVHIGSRPKGQEEVHRWEAPRRGVIWQMDATDLRVGPEKRALVLIEDDFSRYVVGWGVFESPTGEKMVEVLKEAIGRHGKCEAIYTDRGGCFLDWGKETSFQRFLDEQLIDHIVSRPYHPQGKGKVEALFKSIRRELWDVRHFSSWEEAIDSLKRWVHEYNYKRAHMGIDGMTPADRFHGRWEEVRAKIEAATRGRLAAGAGDGSTFEEDTQGAPVEMLRLVVVEDRVEMRLFGRRVVLGSLDK